MSAIVLVGMVGVSRLKEWFAATKIISLGFTCMSILILRTNTPSNMMFFV